MQNVETYPLQWPSWINRTKKTGRARFGDHSIEAARKAASYEIELLGGRYITISSNLKIRQDGLPYSTQRKPADCGIAIYFELKGKALCFACDAWDDPGHNLWAIAKDTEAQRGRLRWKMGSAEQAFAGYEALPDHTQKKAWFEILGIFKGATPDAIRLRFRELALIHHPDKGGETGKWNEINAAYNEGIKERS
jgi:hypothetical protein